MRFASTNVARGLYKRARETGGKSDRVFGQKQSFNFGFVKSIQKKMSGTEDLKNQRAGITSTGNAALSLASLLFLSIGLFTSAGGYHGDLGSVTTYSLPQNSPANEAYGFAALSTSASTLLNDKMGAPRTADGLVDTTVTRKCTLTVDRGGYADPGGKEYRAAKSDAIATQIADTSDDEGYGQNPEIIADLKKGCGYHDSIEASLPITNSTFGATSPNALYAEYAPLTPTEHKVAFDKAMEAVHSCSHTMNGHPMGVNPSASAISLKLTDGGFSVKRLHECAPGHDPSDKVNHDEHACAVHEIPMDDTFSTARLENNVLQSIFSCRPVPVRTSGPYSRFQADCPRDNAIADRAVGPVSENAFNYGDNAVSHSSHTPSWDTCQSDRFESSSCDNTIRFVKEQAFIAATLMGLTALFCKAYGLLVLLTFSEGGKDAGFQAYGGYTKESIGKEMCGTGCGTLLTTFALICSAGEIVFSIGAFVTFLVKLSGHNVITDPDGECFGGYMKSMGYHQTSEESAGWTATTVVAVVAYGIAAGCELVNTFMVCRRRTSDGASWFPEY